MPASLISKPGSSCRKWLSNWKNVIGYDSSVFLSGWSLTCTPSVLPGPEDLAQLTNISGGCWISSDRDLIKASTMQVSNVSSTLDSFLFETGDTLYPVEHQ